MMSKAEGSITMSNASANSISTTTIHLALQQLLDDYQSEKAESQRDNDTQFMQYWECACQTIYEVAAALNIPFDDPWVDPVWVRSAEYQATLRTTGAGKRQGRKHQKEQSS